MEGKRMKRNKLVIIFPLLLIATLLLLELPRLYYAYWDEALLKESGNSQYETTEVKNMDELLQKMEAFTTYSTTSSASDIGYTEAFTSETLVNEIENLTAEIYQLTGGMYATVLKEMKDGQVEAQGMIAQFICFTEEQYVWDIGFLEFSLPKLGVNGQIIYDGDTYKIFSMELVCEADFYDMADVEIAEKVVLQYYEGMILHEITLIRDEHYLLVSPFSLDEIDNSELFQELYDLRNYYWGVSEQEVLSDDESQ